MPTCQGKSPNFVLPSSPFDRSLLTPHLHPGMVIGGLGIWMHPLHKEANDRINILNIGLVNYF